MLCMALKSLGFLNRLKRPSRSGLDGGGGGSGSGAQPAGHKK